MNEVQIAVFLLGKEKYAIPISQIEEILKYQTVTVLPSQPDYVEGVTNVRGRVTLIVDLAKKMNFTIDAIEDRRIIITNVNGNIIGLSVDSVSEIIKVNEDEIDSAEKSGIQVEYVKGIVKYNNNIIVLLDLQRLLLD